MCVYTWLSSYSLSSAAFNLAITVASPWTNTCREKIWNTEHDIVWVCVIYRQLAEMLSSPDVEGWVLWWNYYFPHSQCEQQMRCSLQFEVWNLVKICNILYMIAVNVPTDILRGSFCPVVVTISDGSVITCWDKHKKIKEFREAYVKVVTLLSPSSPLPLPLSPSLLTLASVPSTQ